jgi:hypothetical protein
VYANEVWGVGVWNLIQFNHALISKWLWRYAMECDALWRKLVKIKYDSQIGDWCSKEVGGTYGVGVWNCIRRGWEGFGHYVRHDIMEIGSSIISS